MVYRITRQLFGLCGLRLACAIRQCQDRRSDIRAHRLPLAVPLTNYGSDAVIADNRHHQVHRTDLNSGAGFKLEVGHSARHALITSLAVGQFRLEV
jgi:hypothetical protein